MSKVLGFLRRDLAHVRASVVALVVFAGIVAVPSFYAWFNIAGSWDPYGNARDLRVAVASEDEGYAGDLLPVSVNMGERVVSGLLRSESIGYVEASPKDAVEGVRSGEYYAAVVIPRDFSRRMLGVLSAGAERPEVRFYQNEKANAIAVIVTDKAASAVRADVDESFVEAVASTGAGVLDELGRALDDDGVRELAGRLGAAASDSADALDGAAGRVRDLSELLSSTQGLLGSGAGLADAALAPAADAGEALRDGAEGLSGAGEAVDGARTAVADALSQAAAGLDGVDDALDEALGAAGAQGSRVRDGLARASEAVGDQIGLLQRLSAALGEQDALTEAFQESLGEGGAGYELAGSVRAALGDLSALVADATEELQQLRDGIDETVADLDAGAADAGAARERLAGLVADARSALSGAETSYDQGVRRSLEDLASQVADAATQADAVGDGLAGALAAAGDAGRDASGTLDGTRGGLEETASALEGAAGRLRGLEGRLAAALESGSADQVRAVLSAGPEALASFVAAPVRVERTAVFPVENNGSAMTPFYTTLAIWIGGVVLAALVRATPSEAALAETGCSWRQAYLGRLALFCAVGVCQAALIAGGDLLYLGVQCEHPWLFVLACCVTSAAYVNVIFSLSASFGDVGKAVAVVLMVVQVAGSGGTFPPQMLPAPFQAAYQWLPFVHSEGALRAAMFGVWDADIWRELAVLLAYLGAALALGLALRRPTARAGTWFERRLEATRVM